MKPTMRDIIIITDGDQVAQKAIEVVAHNIGGRCISRSGGNPTPLTGEEIVEQVLRAKYDPVLVMFDDNGNGSEGDGERALEYVATHPDMNVLGIVAVASNTPMVDGIDVDLCVNLDAQVTQCSVDKDGVEHCDRKTHIDGDTVDVLSRLNVPIVVGVGDIGKMHGRDHHIHGAPVTTKAVEIILERSGYLGNESS
ncbi:stage V sporulation protein AE [Ammoniphilus sp. CFH 90114]|uniref:stage V sporulation protein AE n=1 Tax=Ammoniphilus sp. CFH 90114 TaxID=2493665 RepID=UPI00100FEED3|nr:stage V sporulation protein AE [Ammoniphilus sp. CFH 90114]RXT13843.1 stage V sporulation protein AE [Ammoniphilus sp. CFH 90114]